MIEDSQFRAALACTLESTSREALGLPDSVAVYEGKVRDNYTLPDGRRILITTDRISAFDRVLGTLPLKGQILNRLSAWWFEQTRDVAPNHVIEVPDPQVLVAKECKPLPVEMVVRAYVTGVTSTSIWTAYSRGERTFCGHPLPDGLKKNDPLPEPILTPSTKAEHGGHDRSASRAEILASGVITAEHFDKAGALAVALFRRGAELCAARGLILADTKYEFGLDPSGEVVVIDEIHTPDSSRFWFASSYRERVDRGEEPESFDKEYVRRWLTSVGFQGDGPIPTLLDEVRVEASRRYAVAYEAITGSPFDGDGEPPASRIRRNIAHLLTAQR
jgi:phosphoribosylaminoimidazole-succinocarboxamide synthase